MYLSQDYEGIIVRRPHALYKRTRSTDIMKFKPRKSDIYRIVGVKEEVTLFGVLKGTLGALVCASEDNETWFSVGSGFTAEQRKVLWDRQEELPGKYVVVKYQALTPKKVPRFPIFAEILDH
jgi:DNA ligase-1